MARAPAKSFLLRASRILLEQARALEAGYSINGIGKVWPGARAHEQHRDELLYLSSMLRHFSAAFHRSIVLEKRNRKRPTLKRAA